MLDNEPTGGATEGAPEASSAAEPTSAPRGRTRGGRRRGSDDPETGPAGDEAADQSGASRPTRRRRATKAAAEPEPAGASAPADPPAAGDAGTGDAPVKATRTRRRKVEPTASEPPTGSTAAAVDTPTSPAASSDAPTGDAPAETGTRRRSRGGAAPPPVVLFVAPETVEPAPGAQPKAAAKSTRGAKAAGGKAAAGETDAGTEQSGDGTAETGTTSRRRRSRRGSAEPAAEAEAAVDQADTGAEADDGNDADADDEAGGRKRRRRGRRGRGRGKGTGPDDLDDENEDEPEAQQSADEPAEETESSARRRRRRRRRGSGGDDEPAPDDPPNTVVKIRDSRPASDEVQGVAGSTRLEAKRQRRRDGREQRRTRPPILSEAEFLARREAVERVMVVRQRNERTQVAVLEDGILVEHYVTKETNATMVGNVYLGKVQNVLPSMEAAFVDIGRGRNAVLYAGEVNWDVTGLEGRTRTIEQALKPGDPVLVQVTKDPVGHKGARLTSHVALSGRHLVYVPRGHSSGISRKLPDTERRRLRDLLKRLVPEGAGVIVRTAAEGASEDELTRDIARLQALWDSIESKIGNGGAPVLLYEEPDLVIRVVRDLFNEDFAELVVHGEQAWELVEPYVRHVSPDLVQRLKKYTGTGDVFVERRVEEQLLKALDRKVFLPSGGHLVIDRTEAMTVIDVNTGKFTGVGGNLEQTVTRNNLEAAEEVVRQLRLRDTGGIIVIDFIDMVLESNRELVLRRLTECLGRDRTKHQVTEITSLGLVQMTRKRLGQGLLDAFSETCDHCKGRGIIVHTEPVPTKARGGSTADGSGDGKADAKATDGKSDGKVAEGTSRRRGRRGKAVEEAPDGDPVGDEPADSAEQADPDAVPGDAAHAEDGAEPAADGGTEADAADEDPDGDNGRRRGRRGSGRRRTRAAAAM